MTNGTTFEEIFAKERNFMLDIKVVLNGVVVHKLNSPDGFMGSYALAYTWEELKEKINLKDITNSTLSEIELTINISRVTIEYSQIENTYVVGFSDGVQHFSMCVLKSKQLLNDELCLNLVLGFLGNLYFVSQARNFVKREKTGTLMQ